jgi:hypothetical protein
MITEFIKARDFAKQKQRRVVVLVPNKSIAEGISALAAISNDSPMGGRTVFFSDEVGVTVAVPKHPIPEGAFYLKILDQGRKITDQDAQFRSQWREAASGVLE